MMLSAAFLPPEGVVRELQELAGGMAAAGMTAVPADRLFVLITRFGNLTEDIGNRLAWRLADDLGGAQRAVVWFGAPRMNADGEVVVDLRGEVDQFRDLARAVPMIAERHRLYVDRRVFRPELVIACSGLDPTSQLVGRVLAGVADWSSARWETDGVSLMRTRWQAGDDRSEEFLFIPLDARAS